LLTVFLIPPRVRVEVSSSFVKGLVGPGGWEGILRKYVPEAVYRRFLERRG
jgi:pantetheine-phosphate adenylyltransferase